ncbi:MAG TPA: hypothetical protein DCR00_02345, partial [Gammaproteobacteria bacterium]|nr:hypothetical protein [Gammaproteobacteria bacterium]
HFHAPLPWFYLLANGLLLAGLTALFLFAPKVWFANLGIELVDELGYTELKAMYIGLMGTLMLNSLLGAVRERFLDPALDLCLLSYAALASVRAWEILVEGIFDSFTLQLLYAELASA